MAKVQYRVSSDATQYLEPAGGSGVIDIVNDFNWTLTPKEGREEVPPMFVKEYQQTAGQLVASLIYIYKLGLNGITLAGTNTAEQLYRYKYLAKETGWTYYMPYFNQKKYTRETGFSDENSNNPFKSIQSLGEKTIQGFTGRGGQGRPFGIFAEAAAIFTAATQTIDRLIPGKLNLDLPKFWTGTTEGSYEVSFDLFNTGTQQDIINNRNFCEIITRNNTQSRRNAMITDPVCIYSIDCPDVVSMPAAWISNLNITNLGNTRLIEGLFNGGDKVIPEAYRVKIVFQSLLQPSRQIMQGLDDGATVEAITQDANINNKIQGALKTMLTNTRNDPVNIQPTLDQLAVNPP